jgi:hypothetical protein
LEHIFLKRGNKMERFNIDLENGLKGIYETLLAESNNIAPEIHEEIIKIFKELFDEPILA